VSGGQAKELVSKEVETLLRIAPAVWLTRQELFLDLAERAEVVLALVIIPCSEWRPSAELVSEEVETLLSIAPAVWLTRVPHIESKGDIFA